MNRNQLRDAIATKAGLGAGEADRALSAVLESIIEAVAADEKVSVPGFGTFERRERSARTGRNPQTGEEMEIAATAAPAFKPATAFKRTVADR